MGRKQQSNAVIIVLILCLFFYYLNNYYGKNMTNKENIYFSIGESSTDLVKRFDVSHEENIHGISFINISFDNQEVLFKHKEFSFMIKNLNWIMTMEETCNNWGIEEIRAEASFSIKDLSDKQIQNKVYQFIQTLTNKGWKQYYELGDARIYGYKAWREFYGFDIYVQPDINDWKENIPKVGNVFHLYADGVILNIGIEEGFTPEQYKMTFHFEKLDFVYKMLTGIHEKDPENACNKDKWVPMISDILKASTRSRENQEKLNGDLLIDRNYRDPLPKIYLDYLDKK